MRYLELFLTFLKIGTFAFGGGYGMIPVIRQEVLRKGWLDEQVLLDMIGISESTPGPIAVNMATFVGYSQGGILGAALATLGVVLPAFVIILLIAKALSKYRQNPYVRAVLGGIQAVVVGLILATGTELLLAGLFGLDAGRHFAVNFRSAALMVLLLALSFAYKRLTRKSISPIALIAVSAVLGMVFYG
ncbi:MAG: chromate transporter [Eubacteriales bacterium]